MKYNVTFIIGYEVEAEDEATAKDLARKAFKDEVGYEPSDAFYLMTDKQK